MTYYTLIVIRIDDTQPLESPKEPSLQMSSCPKGISFKPDPGELWLDRLLATGWEPLSTQRCDRHTLVTLRIRLPDAFHEHVEAPTTQPTNPS